MARLLSFPIQKKKEPTSSSDSKQKTPNVDNHDSQ